MKLKSNTVPAEEFPFEYKQTIGISDAVLNIIYEQACKAVECTAELAERVSGRATVVLNWLTAALFSLTGILASLLLAEGAKNWLVIIAVAYGLVLLSISMALLMRGTHYKTSLYEGGQSPSESLPQVWASALKELEDARQEHTMKAWCLPELQRKYNYNMNEVRRRIKYYRTAIMVIASGIVAGLALIGVLVFFS